MKHYESKAKVNLYPVNEWRVLPNMAHTSWLARDPEPARFTRVLMGWSGQDEMGGYFDFGPDGDLIGWHHKMTEELARAAYASWKKARELIANAPPRE